MRKLLLIAAMAGLGLAAEPAAATTIYSTFGPGNTFNCCSGTVVTGVLTSGDVFMEAGGFTSPFDADLEQIDIALTWNGGPNTALVSLYTDGGGLPGTAIASWIASGFPDWNSNPTTGAATISGITGVHLTAGTTYYLVAGPVDPSDDTWLAWNYNDQGVVGLQANFQNGHWYPAYDWTQYAFDVLGTATPAPPSVPEPASIALMIGGIAGVVRLRRRKAAK